MRASQQKEAGRRDTDHAGDGVRSGLRARLTSTGEKVIHGRRRELGLPGYLPLRQPAEINQLSQHLSVTHPRPAHRHQRVTIGDAHGRLDRLGPAPPSQLVVPARAAGE